MPHDRNGHQLKVGDCVILRGVVTGTSENSDQVIFRPEVGANPQESPVEIQLAALQLNLESIPSG